MTTTTVSKYVIHKCREKWIIVLQYTSGHKGRLYVSSHPTREEAAAEVVRLECGGW